VFPSINLIVIYMYKILDDVIFDILEFAKLMKMFISLDWI